MGTLVDVCECEKFLWAVCEVIDDLLVRLTEDLSDAFAAIFTMDDFEFGTLGDDSQSGVDLGAFRRSAFNAHNNLRTLHGCPPLLLSEELSGTAQGWADRLAEKGFLQYSENPGLGENISLVDLDQSSRRGEQIVQEWYKEIDNYNYGKPGWKKGAYRFSQLLWKSTTEIGVGVARIPGRKKAWVVVNYRPAGNNNMPGEFERNVLPPQQKTTPGNNANLTRKNNKR